MIKIILLLFFSLNLIGCKKSEPVKSAEKDDKYGDYYVESSIGDATYLNPILASDSASGDINNLIFNGLVKYDKNIKIIGDLAESWSVSEDGKIIIFNLKKNVKWHDGKSFTAEDVEFTYKKLVDPKVKTPYSSDFEIVKKFEIINPYKIRIVYKEPFSPGLISWGMGIIPKHIFEKGDFNTHPANRKPIGTGYYKFVEWKTDEKIVLEANSDYFEGRPYLSKYIYRIIPDQSVQFLELRNETIDSMNLTPDQYNAYKSYFKNYSKFKYPTFGFTYLGYNLLNQLFNEKEIRQAIAYSINKKEIVDGILLGYGLPATGPYPPTSWAYNPEVKDYEYNIEKAKNIFKKYGWSDYNKDGWLDKDGKKFEFTIITNQGNKSRSVACELIQEHLKKVGIKVNIRILEWSTFIHQYVDKKNFDAVILGWNLSRDPDQYALWHSSQKKEGQYNFVNYENKEVDKLLEDGRRIFDEKKRQKIYQRIHKILADEQPYTFLYVPDALPVIHKKFTGPEVAPAGVGWNFREWYVPYEQRKYEMSK
ncbi:MAG: peptide-binding protein [Elusimicrobia bacterium RIFOXYD2_FULL_34_15]|nr:MAG: peptide-binding protein [Elusimicrobia bacterium RIFOXYD2_FULL_34_15]